MLLIVKGKPVRSQCQHCGALTDAVTKRQQSTGVWCEPCKDAILNDVLDDYQSQLDAGIPFENRYVLMPHAAMCDEKFGQSIRVSVSSLDSNSRRRRKSVAL